MYNILNEVLDIRYIDKNNEYKNKQITINQKIIDKDYIDLFIKNFEGHVTIIYDNNSYLNKIFKKKYKGIIKTNLNNEYILKHVIKYFYLDYY